MLVKEAMGLPRAAAFDVGAACSGFVYGYATAHAYVMSGIARHALGDRLELLTRFLDWTDRNTCVLFGDGAGRWCCPRPTSRGRHERPRADRRPGGRVEHLDPGRRGAAASTLAALAAAEQYLRMNGRDTYRYATRTIASTALAAIAQAG
ncbi:MAG: hypothetical protein R3C32_10505 [Chloroflexota bacterium]